MSDPQKPNPFDSSDPADQTQRHSLTPPADEPGRYSPAPEPRSEWAQRAAWSAPAEQPTQERWYEPATPTATATVPAERPHRGAGTGTVVGAALLAAVLASGGTVFALNAMYWKFSSVATSTSYEAAPGTVSQASTASTGTSSTSCGSSWSRCCI